MPEDELLAIASKEVREAYQLMKKPPRYELYDLRADPYEFRNLADDPVHAKTRSPHSETRGLAGANGDALKDSAAARRLFGLIMDAHGQAQSLGLLVHGEETK